MSPLTRRDALGLASAASAALVFGHKAGYAKDPPKKESVKVEVVGELGTILRAPKSEWVTASIQAGGGEFLIDGSESKEVRKELIRLAEKYIKPGSSIVVLPQLKVTGRLEYRGTKLAEGHGEKHNRAKAWVLVADSVTEIELPGK
ncbi:MAG: twin-arginine translocation signal domain-containing protein [Planctomycetales bacterium]|nr:twin-arginine translocation signal domain-containing protein [Planctomycetales bacterium]